MPNFPGPTRNNTNNEHDSMMIVRPDRNMEIAARPSQVSGGHPYQRPGAMTIKNVPNQNSQ